MSRGVAIGCAAVALTAAAWRVPVTALHLGRLATASSDLTFPIRDTAGGNGVIGDRAALYEARATIPEHASYRMIVGPNVHGLTMEPDYVPLYYLTFLLPRHQSERAQWIVCFGCDLRSDAPGAQELWRDDYGISIARRAG